MEELSKRLAEYVVSVESDQIPEDVVEFTKLCILDYFGSAFSGASEGPIKMIDDMVASFGGAPQATLVTGGQTSVANAALVNGAASHISELDDIHKASIIHAATVVIPAALAVAEWKKLSGKDFITAVAVGYEVCFRIGEAVSPSHYYFWHNTATCGTFGAAAAVAKLLNLNVEEIIHTLGSAGTQAAGLWEFIEDGAMTKQLHPGKAAMNGVISALLAEKGFTAARKILEGRRGFFEAMSDEYDSSKITNDLGQVWKITENSFKIHASCRHTHHAMDMAISLKNSHDLTPEKIKSVHVKTYQTALDITDNDQPDTVYAGKFSLQYCTALALTKGAGGLDQYTQVALWDDSIRSLMERVKVSKNDMIDAAYPEKWGAAIEVETSSGDILTMEVEFPKGDPENPVTQEDLVEKFIILSQDTEQIKPLQFVENVLNLEKFEEINNLMQPFHEKVESKLN